MQVKESEVQNKNQEEILVATMFNGENETHERFNVRLVVLSCCIMYTKYTNIL